MALWGSSDLVYTSDGSGSTVAVSGVTITGTGTTFNDADLKRKKELVTYGNDRDNAIFNTVDRVGVYSGFNDAVKQSTQRGEVREDTYQGLFDSVKKLMGNSATDDEVFTAVNGIYMQRILYKYGTTGTGRATPGQILKFGKRNN